MSVPEAATYLGVTPEQVRRYIATGLLAAEHIGRRVWVLRRSDVITFQRPRRGWPKGKPRKSPGGAPE